MFSKRTHEWLITNGFNPETAHSFKNYQYTPLIHACRHGNAAVAFELLKTRTAKDLQNTDGVDALWACVFSNAFAIAEALLEKGVSVNRRKDNGASLLMYVSSAGKTKWVTFLIERGADVYMSTKDDITAFELASNIECTHLLRQQFASTGRSKRLLNKS